jgi:hypothetical protein
MFGEEYKKEILKIPMSDNTIRRRVQDMSQDAESQVTANIKEADFLPSSWTSQLTSLEKSTPSIQQAFFFCTGDINEQILFC